MARLSDKNNSLTFVPAPQSPDKAGFVKETADDVVPDGWLECNGQAVSRTTYSELFNLIGTTYGAGDGSTTFNLPGGSQLNTPQIVGNTSIKKGDSGATISAIAEQLVVESDGNTGITIASPASNASALYFANSTSPAGGYLFWDFDGDTNGLFDIGTAKTGGQLKFSTGTGVEAMRINSSGNVGIGTSSPVGVGLDVQYTSGPAAYFWRGAASSFSAVSIAHVSSNSGQDFIQFQYGAATGVGSGTNAGGIERSGATTTPAFFTGSDRRIKENITDMPATLSKLCQIQLKEFDYKDTDAHACGPIAQDLYLIFPDKVKAFGDGLGEEVPENERPWTVNRDWDWEIIKAIQELKAKNDELKARIEALESN